MLRAHGPSKLKTQSTANEKSKGYIFINQIPPPDNYDDYDYDDRGEPDENDHDDNLALLRVRALAQLKLVGACHCARKSHLAADRGPRSQSGLAQSLPRVHAETGPLQRRPEPVQCADQVAVELLVNVPALEGFRW